MDTEKRIVLLGSTGSIGENVLRIVSDLPGRFRVVGLAAGRNADRVAQQAAEFGVPLAARDRAELSAIPDLAPGDFRTVRQSMRYLGGARDAAALLRALREESDAKRDRGASRDRRIGF